MANDSLIEKDIGNEYLSELERNPKYSLVVDPENKYNFPDDQRKFIEQYVQLKDVKLAAKYADINNKEAQAYYVAYNTQAEIRRINLAMYHRQFAQRMLTLDQLGGYLSSLITEENVAPHDRLSTAAKLRVVDMLIELNKYKFETLYNNPRNMIHVQNVEEELKDLSIDTIKDLLKRASEKKITAYEKDPTKSTEENFYLETLNNKELLNIIDETQNKEEK